MPKRVPIAGKTLKNRYFTRPALFSGHNDVFMLKEDIHIRSQNYL
jgi:hypothetical protein